jgi:hypothetical protein
MKYKDQVGEYQRAIIGIRLAYVMRVVQMRKEKEQLENRISVLENTINSMQSRQEKKSSEPLPRGNCKTEIHFITKYSGLNEFKDAMKLVNIIVPLNIVDEVNIELPDISRLINNTYPE